MKTWSIVAAVCAASTLMACNDKPVRESNAPGAGEEVCGGGENVLLPTERELCVYRQPIVIETGFMCPAVRSERFDFETFSACASFRPLREIEIDFLRDRFDARLSYMNRTRVQTVCATLNNTW